MAKLCLIVGIDEYVFKPLTSAVNDAIRVREKLIATGLFEPNEIDCLLSPRKDHAVELPPKASAATRDSILGYCRALYQAKQPLDRFVFYFAGHGISVYSDAARAELRTVLIPADVGSVGDDGDRLIDFDSLRSRFSMRGPLEQLYIIDACRDLGWDKHPDVGRLGWAAEPNEAPRAQATLYAVAPMGQALGVAEGLGVMSRHLNDGFEAQGSALDSVFRDGKRVCAITVRSLHEYVQRRVKKELEGVQSWRLKFMVPLLDDPDPKWSPLRYVPHPPVYKFTVNIEPPAAEMAVEATLSMYQYQVARWPPYGKSIQPAPTIYEFSARLTGDGGTWQTPEPQWRSVDVREESTVTVTVSPRDAPPAPGTEAIAAVPVVETGPPVQPTSAVAVASSSHFAEVVIDKKSKYEVELAQYMLRKSNFFPQPIKVDGYYGPVTETAVRTFQSLKNLPVNGVVDGGTWHSLRSVVAPAIQWPNVASASKRSAYARAGAPWMRSFPKRGIAIGSRRKEAVKAIQLLANTIVPLEIDGDFGQITEGAIRLFQKRAALPVNGRVDPPTWEHLCEAASQQPAEVQTHALDPGVTVELEALSGPGETHMLAAGESASLPPGPYRVRFRLGHDVLNETELVLGPGQRRTLRATAERGQALAQLLAPTDPPAAQKYAYMPSETIGSMQAAVLPTLLPLIGLKTFDQRGEILRRLNLNVPLIGTVPNGHLAVTVAVEGDWKKDPRTTISNATVTARRPDGTEARLLHPLAAVTERIALGVTQPGLGSCNVTLAIANAIYIDIATCIIPYRLTCLGIVIYEDGRTRLSQSLLVPPQGTAEPGNDVSVKPARVARLIALAERIYSTGGIPSNFNDPDIEQLEYGKWADPLLGVLACLVRMGDVATIKSPAPQDDSDVVLPNLRRFFGTIPDVQVISAARSAASWDPMMSGPVTHPIFAANARVLGDVATKRGYDDHPYVQRAKRLRPDNIWNVIIGPPLR